MDYKINHLSTVEKELEISFSAEEVQAQFKQEYSHLSHTVTVKGFRPGKVPLNVLKQFYGKNVKADVEHHFISEGMQDAVIKEKLRLATNPEIFDETELSETAAFSFKLRAEVFPEIDAELKPFEREFTPIKYDETMLENELEAIKARFIEYKESDEELTAEKDRLVISFVGKIDGKEVENTAGKDVTVIVGDGKFVPDFEKALYGHKKGDSFTADVKFPEDYRSKELAGKTVQFTIDITKVEKCENAPELTDEFLAGKEGYPNTVAELKDQIKKNIENYLDDISMQGKKNIAIETYVKEFEFEVPPSFLMNEKNARIDDYKKEFKVEEVPAEELAKIEDDAKFAIKRYIILNTFADKLNITVTDKDVDIAFAQEAAQYGLPAEFANKLREYAGEERINAKKYEIKEQKVLDKMVEKMVFTEKEAEKDPAKAEKAEKTEEKKAEKKPAAKRTTKKAAEKEAE